MEIDLKRLEDEYLHSKGFIIVTPESYVIIYLQNEEKYNLELDIKKYIEGELHTVIYNTGVTLLRSTDNMLDTINVLDLTRAIDTESKCLKLLINQQIRLMSNMKDMTKKEKADMDHAMISDFEVSMLDSPIYVKTIETKVVEPEEFIKTEIIIRELTKKIGVVEKSLYVGNGQESILSKLSNIDTRVKENDDDIESIRNKIEKGKVPLTLIDIIRNTPIKSMVVILIALSLSIGLVDKYIIPQIATIVGDGITEVFMKPLE